MTQLIVTRERVGIITRRTFPFEGETPPPALEREALAWARVLREEGQLGDRVAVLVETDADGEDGTSRETLCHEAVAVAWGERAAGTRLSWAQTWPSEETPRRWYPLAPPVRALVLARQRLAKGGALR